MSPFPLCVALKSQVSYQKNVKKTHHDTFADIDECANPSDNWCETASDDHVTCENMNGGYRCACSEGYELKPNGIACQGNYLFGIILTERKGKVNPLSRPVYSFS